MIIRSCHAATSALALAIGLLLPSCDRPQSEGDYVEKPDWTPHEKKLLSFIARYKTDDAQQARAAMTEELEYLSQPLDAAVSDERLAYLRALARIRLAMITHHLGDERGARALFDLGTMEFNQWSENEQGKRYEPAQVIETVIEQDQGFEAPWHEPWKSRMAQAEEA